jgi:predicted glutamine amidotransferase
MCGIVGFVANGDTRTLYNRRANFLYQGLHVDSLRGQGGTGVALVTDKGDVESYKRALSGPDFINSDVADRGYARMDLARIAIGHNRAATIGSVKDKNCHPFHYKEKREIILVHNGTLHDHRRLTPVGFNHDVDSAHAAFALAESEDVAKTLKSINGWFVFVWWDGTDKTFNIARNDNRDIFYSSDTAGNLYYGSEYKMLDWLTTRNSVEFDKNAKWVYPGEHQWFSWKITPDGLSAKPKMIDIKPEPKASVYTPPAREPFEGRNRAFDFSTVELETMKLKRDEIVEVFLEDYEGYQGQENQKEKKDQFGKIFGHCYDGAGKKQEVWVHSVRVAGWALYEKYFKEKGNTLPCRVIRVQEVTKNRGLTKIIICDTHLTEIAQRVKETQAREGKTVTEAVKKVIKDAKVELDLDDQPELIQGPGSIFLPEGAWKELVKPGCAVCSSGVTKEDADKITWLPGTPATFLCGTCSEDDDARDMASLPSRSKVH